MQAFWMPRRTGPEGEDLKVGKSILASIYKEGFTYYYITGCEKYSIPSADSRTLGKTFHSLDDIKRVAFSYVREHFRLQNENVKR